MSPNTPRQFFIFCCIGVLNTLICFGMIAFLTLAFHMHHVPANILGYIFALGIGFTLHSLITFSNVPDQHAWPSRFKRFIIVFMGAYTLQFIALLIMVDVLKWYELLAQIMACGVYTVFSYLGSKFYTFVKKTPRHF